mgnify:FL=1
MKEIILHWQPVINLDELILGKIKIHPAIYVWGWFDADKNFVPYYVGKTNNLGQRFISHLGCIKGGMYAIYSKEYAISKNFKPLKEEDETRLLYIPSTIKNWHTKFNTYPVQKNVKWLLKNIRFSWAETSMEDNKDFEKIVYHAFNASTKKVGAYVKGIPDPTIKVLHTGDESIQKIVPNLI